MPLFINLVVYSLHFISFRPVTTYSMAPAVTMAPIGNLLSYLFIYLLTHALTLELNISIACNSKWGCYNWTASSWGSCTWKDPNCYDMWTPVNITGILHLLIYSLAFLLIYFLRGI